ncbi:MAG: hypothetical protein AMXMBFR47_19140 [Planctomycetota bacterium]
MRATVPLLLSAGVLSQFSAPLAVADCGHGWIPVPADFRTPQIVGAVHAIAAYDPDGEGPAPRDIIIAGQFLSAGGVSVERIARWDGLTWHPLRDGLNNVVRALVVYDPDGDGPDNPLLIVGGDFTATGTDPLAAVAAWDGNRWNAMSDGLTGAVKALTVFDPDGEGPAAPSLLAGGSFTASGRTELRNLARWTGSEWEDFGGGVTGADGVVVVAEVNSFTAFDHDANPATPAELVIGGAFALAGGVPINCVAAWDGVTWHGFGASQFVGFPYPNVYSVSASGGASPRLVAGGAFDETDGEATLGIAEWDGVAWRRMPGLVGIFYTVTHFDHDASPATADLVVTSGALYHELLGSTGFAVWDGVEWSIPGTAIDGYALAMPLNPDPVLATEPALLLGGIFSDADGLDVGNLVLWSAPSGLTGDLDADGDVDLGDLASLLAQFGCSEGCGTADVDSDGDVDISDLAGLLAAYGTTCP